MGRVSRMTRFGSLPTEYSSTSPCFLIPYSACAYKSPIIESVIVQILTVLPATVLYQMAQICIMVDSYLSMGSIQDLI